MPIITFFCSCLKEIACTNLHAILFYCFKLEKPLTVQKALGPVSKEWHSIRHIVGHMERLHLKGVLC